MKEPRNEARPFLWYPDVPSCAPLEKMTNIIPQRCIRGGKKKKKKREIWNPPQFFESRHRRVTSAFMAVMQVLILNKQRCSSATVEDMACTAHPVSYLLDLNTCIQRILHTSLLNMQAGQSSACKCSKSSYKTNIEPGCLSRRSIHHF